MRDLSEYGIRVHSLTSYEVQSSRHPGVWYRVRLTANTETCECPSRKPCKHQRMAAFVGYVLNSPKDRAFWKFISQITPEVEFSELLIPCLKMRVEMSHEAMQREPERERVAA